MLKKKTPPLPEAPPRLVLHIDVNGFNASQALYNGLIKMIDQTIKAQGADHVQAVIALATLAQAAATNSLAFATVLAKADVVLKENVKP